MGKPYIYWTIDGKFVNFYLKKDNGDEPSKAVHIEELENVIGDYVDQREDEWVEKERK